VQLQRGSCRNDSPYFRRFALRRSKNRGLVGCGEVRFFRKKGDGLARKSGFPARETGFLARKGRSLSRKRGLLARKGRLSCKKGPLSCEKEGDSCKKEPLSCEKERDSCKKDPLSSKKARVACMKSPAFLPANSISYCVGSSPRSRSMSSTQPSSASSRCAVRVISGSWQIPAKGTFRARPR
jgi:hypothetical protein